MATKMMASDARARPILMSGAMVRAIIAGTKTQTRRVFTVPTPDGRRAAITSPLERVELWDDGAHYFSTAAMSGPYPCPFGRPGDLLYVKETIERVYPGTNRYLARYRADGELCRLAYFKAVTAANHTYRHDSRLTLELTDVRVQRVQEISEEDAVAEGVEPALLLHEMVGGAPDKYRRGFRALWQSLNAKRGYGWRENPWCWCLSFRAHRQNVDALLEERRHAA